MKFYRIIIMAVFSLLVLSCGKNDEKDEKVPKTVPAKESNLPTKNNKVVEKDSVSAVKHSILRTKTYKKKEAEVNNDSIVVNKKQAAEPTKVPVNATAKSIKANNSFVYLRKILNDCKVGQTLTQKELSTNLHIPKEAMKLVKSIEKISDNEIDIKWKSTWLVEKVSDAKLKDGILKMNFKDNKMYTSGEAIGIKYNDKMYYDLVITGHNARIPSVKGYYWQIGKD